MRLSIPSFSIVCILFILFVLSKYFLDHLSFVKTINRIWCAQLFPIFQTKSAKLKHYLKRENKVNKIKV